MEADSTVESHHGSANNSNIILENASNRRLNIEETESAADETIHAFNESSTNITVIENSPPCEGSDSGVEVIETHEIYQRALSAASQEFEACPRSCDSSIISCCSNYEEAYNLLVRRNSTLIEDYTSRNGDGSSENGSESSSLTGGSATSRQSKRTSFLNAKKRVNLQEPKKGITPKERSRSKPPITPKRGETTRLKSVDRLQGKNEKKTPNSLDLNGKKETKRPSSTKVKTPILTPTDDGRWPSINSKPAPLMSRSIRGILDAKESPKTKPNETKTIEKYATLPRRRKDKPNICDDKNKLTIPAKKLLSRETTPSKQIANNTKKKQKIKIYHETAVQTALTISDVTKALAGLTVTPLAPNHVDKCDKNEQADIDCQIIEKLEAQIKVLQEKYEILQNEFKNQQIKLTDTESQLRQETVEKEGLKEELKVNSQRVLAILGENQTNEGETVSSDSLTVLESRFQNVSQIVIRQEEEISKLNSLCRSLQMDLEKSVATQKILVQQHQELEAESRELQEFMQAEKTTLSDALKDAEYEMNKTTQLLAKKDKELQEKIEEIRRLTEQKWQEKMGSQARMGALEAKIRELLVHQGSSVSGTAVALSALIARLEGLTDELVTSYSISDQELDDVIFHNEAYSNGSSSPDVTPEKSKFLGCEKTPSPKKGSSFISAVINAIRNAAAHKYTSKENICLDSSSPNEMLDSETEPCLMMEHVLEDVVIPDGHTHNMISSCHSILNSQSEDLSRSGFYNEMPALCDVFPSSLSLVDQVIDVDNLVTRLLKVIRIIQLENDDCMNEMQEQRDRLVEQMDKQKENYKLVTKQLKDWEVLGARLKTEVKELMQQVSRKNNEIDNLKCEINKQREQIEKLNQDVCELSTTLSKAEHDMKMKEEEVGEAMRNWEKSNEKPTPEVIARLIASQNEVPMLKEKLLLKEQHLTQLTQELLSNRQLLTDSLQEAKNQYEAIDNALEVLHKNQNIVQQCPPLAELQRELENTSFQSTLAMPLATPADCNANAALLLQAVTNNA